jgi:short-subunit dehydrogenase
MSDLNGRRVLITGASSGIGLLCAADMAAEGAEVALIARSRTGLDEAARRANENGGEAHVYEADVTDRDALSAAVAAAVEDMGGLDVAVSAAGAAAYGEFRTTPAEDFDRTVEVTFLGAVNLVRAVLPHLETSDGNLVIVGSASDRVPLPLQSAYTASKAALSAFTEVLRAELKACGSDVSVSLLRPGPVDTPFWSHVTNPDGLAPPRPAFVYSAETVSRAVVELAKRPRPSITVGGAMAAVQIATLVGPLARAALGISTRLAIRASEHRPGVVKALWEPSGNGESAESGSNRRSLWVDFRLRRLPF